VEADVNVDVEDGGEVAVEGALGGEGDDMVEAAAEDDMVEEDMAEEVGYSDAGNALLCGEEGEYAEEYEREGEEEEAEEEEEEEEYGQGDDEGMSSQTAQDVIAHEDAEFSAPGASAAKETDDTSTPVIADKEEDVFSAEDKTIIPDEAASAPSITNTVSESVDEVAETPLQCPERPVPTAVPDGLIAASAPNLLQTGSTLNINTESLLGMSLPPPDVLPPTPSVPLMFDMLPGAGALPPPSDPLIILPLPPIQSDASAGVSGDEHFFSLSASGGGSSNMITAKTDSNDSVLPKLESIVSEEMTEPSASENGWEGKRKLSNISSGSNDDESNRVVEHTEKKLPSSSYEGKYEN
jgi:hypothetical protein